MNIAGIVGSGYGLLCAVALGLALALAGGGRLAPRVRVAGGLLLAALAVLQAVYLTRLLGLGTPALLDQAPYRMALFAVAPCFYAFARPWLAPAQTSPPAAREAWQGLPVLLAPWLPEAAVRPLAFGLGALYLLWLARALWALRAERRRFAAEAALLGLAVVLGLVMVVVALLPEGWPSRHFVALHASAIGWALALVQVAATLRPDLPQAVQEAAQTRYATSTLGRVDCDAALGRLHALMTQDRLYADPDLGLAVLAARLNLSPHQLSELLNARLGKSFARYLREQRVAAARQLLRAEPSASVLSVGLNVGFTSQSSFYDAFREIEGTTPGQFRKLRG